MTTTFEDYLKERQSRTRLKKLYIWFRCRLPHIITHEWPRKRHELIWFWQRGRRGWADIDAVDIYSYLTPIIKAMVIRMRDGAVSTPADITPEAWNAILDEIITGFEAAQRISDFDYPSKYGHDNWRKPLQQDLQTFNHGMNLFKKWYFALWD